ncbi:MAG TPA: RNA polymerase sigma factor [Steroidobacteraceae bacterium]|nr:RNA polymerase sigma factor [Steroidobacteraceae bacterium]
MSYFQAEDIPPDTLRAAIAGDRQAHAAIYKAYQRPLYNLIRRLIPRAAVADELFQDTFVEILRNIHSYSGEGSFAGWVRSVAVNKCLMYLRSPWHRALLQFEGREDESSLRSLFDTRASDPAYETQQALQQALSVLPTLSRAVVWLHDVEGYTHGEIGRMLNRTPSFSKSQLARAHARLREMLDPQAESVPCTPVSTNC